MGAQSEGYGDMVNFHEQAITQGCHRSLDILRDFDFMDDFYLAGGTALALQIGHRISTDLDWFSNRQEISCRFARSAPPSPLTKRHVSAPYGCLPPQVGEGSKSPLSQPGRGPQGRSRPAGGRRGEGESTKLFLDAY